MRSANSAVAAVALALAACGNYSNEDIRFYEAVPTRQMLRVQVPAPAAQPGALSACTPGYGSADVWLWAKPTGDGLNNAIDFILGLVDLVRRYPPTTRTADSRTWGPFDDKHAGREDRVTITRRDQGCVPGGPVCWVFVLAARVKGQGAFQPILEAQFQGASAGQGDGSLAIHFDTIWALGMNDPPDPQKPGDTGTPHGEMGIAYSRSGDPRTTELSFQQPGFSLPQFDYAWQGWADGHGRFVYRLIDANGNVLTIDARYDDAGRGRADVTVLTPGGFTAGFSECWNQAACVQWVDDPFNFTNICGLLPVSCVLGSVTSCAVP